MITDMQELGATGRNIPALPWGMLVQQTAITSGTLILSGSSAPWVMDAAKKLEALGKLPPGWDSYGGLTLDANARRLTVSALGWLGNQDLPVPAVVLGSGGSVQLEWKAKGRELDIELGKNETIQFVKVKEGGDILEGEEKAHLPQKLRDLTWWLLSG